MPNNEFVIQEHRPSRADAVKNREILLDTAVRLFSTFGVESVSMTQLAQAAGVGKGTLYRHFKDKDELCHALLDHDMRELQTQTLLRARQVHDPVDNLSWFLEQVVRFVADHVNLLMAVPESARTLIHPAHIWWRQTIRGFLVQIKPQGDLDYLTDMLYMMLNVNTLFFQIHVREYELDRIIVGLHLVMRKIIV